MGRLDGKVALISGGARGQGAREAEVFAAEGAKVVFGDILDQEGRAVEEQIKSAGGDAVYLHLDVTSDEDWQKAVDLAESRYGRLDVLINNAGIARSENVEDTTEELWERVMSINTTGVFLGTRRAIPAMRRAGGGRAGRPPLGWRRLQRLQGSGAHLQQSDCRAIRARPNTLQLHTSGPDPDLDAGSYG